MKKIIGFLFMGLVSVSYADHRLSDILPENKGFDAAVKTAERRERVKCDVKNSFQIKAGRQGSDIWRQVALCYDTVAELEAARGKPANETDVDAVLDITYKFGANDAFADAAILKFDLR